MYKTFLIDPPWPERGGGKIKRGADRHYDLLNVRDIWRVIATAPKFKPAADAHLYLWVTNNYLKDGLGVMHDLGFRYVTNVAWVKVGDGDLYRLLRKMGEACLRPRSFGKDKMDFLAMQFSAVDVCKAALQIGLGQYFRGAHELLLFGVHGEAMVPEPPNRLPSVVFAPRGKHSAKPEVFYQRIEQTSPGPYVEMFARNRRDGWDVWGNEVEA